MDWLIDLLVVINQSINQSINAYVIGALLTSSKVVHSVQMKIKAQMEKIFFLVVFHSRFLNIVFLIGIIDN